MDERWVRADRSPWRLRALAAAVALAVTAPLLGRGYVLQADMVFVPRFPLDATALGLSGSLPRAVPEDAVLAVLTSVVPGDWLQKLVLVGTVFAAVLGAGRLVPPGRDGRRGVAGAVAGLVYGWSPYLAERLLMGHWALLLAWAALPWVVRAALLLRAGEPRALRRLVLVLAPAAMTPTGALLAGGLALALTGRRRVAPVAAVVAVLCAPWVVAGVLHPAGGGSDPSGVAAFAARAENWAGPVGALLGTGGIWNAGAVPASRASALAPLATLALLALAAWGWAGGRRPHRSAWAQPGGRLLLLGAIGLAVAAAGALPGTAGLLEWAVREVPGGGLLRDGQKWVAWTALPLALGCGLGVRRLLASRDWAPVGRVVAVVALLVPLAGTPDLAWGVGGRLAPVAYPADWQRVHDLLADAPEDGDVLVLPFGATRQFGWNDDRPQADPAPRLLPRSSVVDDRLFVGGQPVEGEDARARAVGAVQDDPAALARAGVGWVLVEHGTPGAEVAPAVQALPRVFSGRWLDLYRVPGAVPGPAASTNRTVSVVAAHLLAGTTVALAGLSSLGVAATVPLRRRPPGTWYSS